MDGGTAPPSIGPRLRYRRGSASTRKAFPVSALDYDAYDVLTFDTYGTLIDWETGLVGALRSVLGEAAAASATRTC